MATETPAPTPPPSGGLTEEAAADLLALLPESSEPEPAAAEPDTPEPLDGKDPEPEPEPAAPDTYEVTADGRVERVPLDELKKGYSRTQDYTRKTQAIAAERKAFEAERAKEQAKIRAARDQFAAKIEKLDSAIAGLTPEEPDFDRIKRETPDQFPAAVAEWQLIKEKRATLAAERQKITDEQDQERAQQWQARLAEEQERLHAAIPDLKDEAKGRVLKDQMLAYGERQGFTRDEVALTSDHRLVVMLRKAMLYDELLTKRDSLQPPRKDAPKAAPTLEPGTRTAPLPKGRKDAQAAFSRLKETGSVKDAARVLQSLDL